MLTKNKLLKSNSKKPINVALIEVDGSHDECLLSQIHALKRTNSHVVLLCTQEIKERNTTFEALVDELIIIDSSHKHNKIVRTIISIFRKKHIDIAVFNTAQGAKVRDLSVKLFFSRIKLFGIIHTTRKFDDSFRQKVININITKYLVLSEYLYKKAKPRRRISVDYFYPIRFPEFGSKRVKNSVLTISIIGGVEKRRKDLDGFIEMVLATKNDAIQFVFLGKSDPKSREVIELKDKLKDIGLLDRVKMFDSFVSQEKFDALLRQTDALLPLVHPNTPSADQYFKNQISGAVNVAFGYGIPLLIHSSYSVIDELKERTIFYDLENFTTIISSCRPQLESIEAWMKEDKEMTNETQELRYLNFLGFSSNTSN